MTELETREKLRVDRWLRESGVWNDLSHTENNELHTAITSYEELNKLIKLAYDAGWTNANLKYTEW